MLCKVPGNFNVKKLRVIQLTEADSKMYLQLVWGKQMMQNTIQHDFFLTERIGNCPGLLCSSSILLKVIIFDLICLFCADTAIFNSNAKVYYNPMIAHLALLCYQPLDLPEKSHKFLPHFCEPPSIMSKIITVPQKNTIAIQHKRYIESYRKLVLYLQYGSLLVLFLYRHTIKSFLWRE